MKFNFNEILLILLIFLIITTSILGLSGFYDKLFPSSNNTNQSVLSQDISENDSIEINFINNHQTNDFESSNIQIFNNLPEEDNVTNWGSLQ